MTAQPLEAFRLGLFLVIALMVTLISQGFGMIVGAAFGVKVSFYFCFCLFLFFYGFAHFQFVYLFSFLQLGVVVGPFVIAPFVVFSGFFLRLADAPKWLHWLFHASFLKYATEGATHAIFGYGRPKLECKEIFCYYQMPSKFMKMIDMHHGDFITAFAILSAICVSLRVIAFFILALRLKKR